MGRPARISGRPLPPIPMRRAATEAGDQEMLNLWAGTGHALAPEGSAVAALRELSSGL